MKPGREEEEVETKGLASCRQYYKPSRHQKYSREGTPRGLADYGNVCVSGGLMDLDRRGPIRETLFRAHSDLQCSADHCLNHIVSVPPVPLHLGAPNIAPVQFRVGGWCSVFATYHNISPRSWKAAHLLIFLGPNVIH